MSLKDERIQHLFLRGGIFRCPKKRTELKLSQPLTLKSDEKQERVQVQFAQEGEIAPLVIYQKMIVENTFHT